jgi:hypothetical protein
MTVTLNQSSQTLLHSIAHIEPVPLGHGRRLRLRICYTVPPQASSYKFGSRAPNMVTTRLTLTFVRFEFHSDPPYYNFALVS